jgi:aminopeptidase N
LDIATHALQIYSKRFGAYPYASFKVVEGPMRGGAGGMEFSGVVSIASFLFDDMDKQMQELGASLGVGDIEKTMAQLFPEQAAENGADENANPATEMLGGLLGGQKAILDSLLEQTIAHETAHQWWAMAVGSDAQRAPWVDESLTNYSAMIYFEDRYGKEKAAQMLELHLKGTYSTGRMMGGADAPVNLSTAAYENNLQYGAVVYGKGALFYDALRKLIGNENFFAGLRAYYQKYNGEIAPARGLLEIMKTQAPQKANEIETLFHRWIEETHGDEDIAGGKISGVQDLLGGLLGGMMGGMEQ